MASEKELKQINKNAILVHQLLPEDKHSALSYFSKDSIEKMSYDSKGLQIFFKEYDLVKKSIFRQKIEVKGLFYKIYPMVTNVTITGIGPYATNLTIEGIMQDYGFIIGSYQIKEIMEQNGYKTVYLTNNYRIILDVPEVFAPKLRPIKLPDINKTFEVLYFCRFCRNNGHMQFQCPKVVKRSSSSFMDVSRRISYENDSSDFGIKNDRISYPQSDFCVDPQISKTVHHFQVKAEKKRKYIPDRGCFSKNSCHSSSSTHHQNVSKRKFCEKSSVPRNNGTNIRQSDFCVNKRNSKILSGCRVKIEKEQNYFSGQNCLSSINQPSIDVSREIPCENDSGGLAINNNDINSPASDVCVDRKISEIRPDSNAKTEKEQNYFPDRSPNSKTVLHCSSSTYRQSTSVSKRKFCKKYSGDLIINNYTITRPDPDFCVDSRSSKNHSHVKTEKEQNYFKDRSCYSKHSRHSSSSTYHQSVDDSGRKSCKNDSKDLVVSSNRTISRQFDSCVNKRSSKTRSDFRVKIEEEQNYLSGQNRHCKNSFPSSSFTNHQSMDVSRGMECEDDSGDLAINDNEIISPTSNFSIDHRNPEFRPDFHVKTGKEQPTQNCYSRNKSYKNDICESSHVKFSHSKTKNFYNEHQMVDCVKVPEKHRRVKISSMPIDDNEKCKDYNSSASKEEQSIENLGRGREKRNVDQFCENEDTSERIEASTSNECTHKRASTTNSKKKKKREKMFIRLLSSLLPPNVDVLETAGLINKALNCKPRDIPEEAKAVLLIILQHNRGLKKKIIHKKARTFLNWISALLREIKKQEKVQSEKYFKDPLKHPEKKQGKVKDGKSATDIPEHQSPGKRKITLSLGIREAISKTSGELEPTLLCNFLNQVRGRKKLFEVANVFTKNIPALASQLLEVQNTYYKYVQTRGSEEDRDIRYMKRLRLRLQQHSGNTTDVLENEVSLTEVPSEIQLDIEKVSVKTESDITEISVKIESDMSEMSVKTESNMTEMFVKESDVAKTESDMTEMCVKREADMTEMCVKTESDMTETFVKREADMTEISIKRENELFMRQSGSEEKFFGKDFSSNCRYGASYFTNITQMPFSFTSLKTEVNYTD